MALKLYSLREMSHLPEPEWRVYGVIPAGISVLWGAEGSYKTFLGISWAVAVAAGLPWLDRRTRPGGVLYIVGEGALRSFHNRVMAEGLALGLSPEEVNSLPFLGTEGPANLTSASNTDIDHILSRVNFPIGLTVVDTLSRCTPGADENKQQDIGRFIAALQRLQFSLRCDVLVLHHANRGGDRRGSSVLSADADGVLELSRGEPRADSSIPISILPNKLKEADSGPHAPPLKRLLVRTVPVLDEAGLPVLDEAGAPRTTCRLEEDHGRGVVVSDVSERILECLSKHSEGMSANQIHAEIHGRRDRILQAINTLSSIGKITRSGSGSYASWRLVEGGAELSTPDSDLLVPLVPPHSGEPGTSELGTGVSGELPEDWLRRAN